LVARLRDVEFADGSVMHVDLHTATTPAPEASVFAALVVLTDLDGHYAVVFSPRRAEWGPPGGGREPGERVLDCVLREVREETGLLLDAGALVVLGEERFVPVSISGRWPASGGVLQLFGSRVNASSPPLVASEADATDPQWVSYMRFRELAGDRFWWPLIEATRRPCARSDEESPEQMSPDAAP
jgi:8-oxo-dGTP pyrophosphatase MutT (NUDIX family)